MQGALVPNHPSQIPRIQTLSFFGWHAPIPFQIYAFLKLPGTAQLYMIFSLFYYFIQLFQPFSLYILKRKSRVEFNSKILFLHCYSMQGNRYNEVSSTSHVSIPPRFANLGPKIPVNSKIRCLFERKKERERYQPGEV